MTRLKILTIYKWATMGGVERVILNRAHAIQNSNLNIEYDVHFIHDSGGKSKFIKYINDNRLNSLVKIVDNIQSNYDLIFSIDTPEIFKLADPKKTYIECHTSYKRNRAYLKDIPKEIRGILVPSHQFYDEILTEIDDELQSKLHVLSNNVFVKKELDFIPKVYNKTPILYIGRIDILKNVQELIKIIASYNKKHGDHLILIIAGNVIEHEIDLIGLLKKYDMQQRTVYLPPMNFDKIWGLLNFIKSERGVFMSASLQESFGLSVAEAMAFEIPVLALKNKAHSNLLKDDARFLYDGGNTDDAIKKLNELIVQYGTSTEIIRDYFEEIQNRFVSEFQVLTHLEGG